MLGPSQSRARVSRSVITPLLLLELEGITKLCIRSDLVGSFRAQMMPSILVGFTSFLMRCRVFVRAPFAHLTLFAGSCRSGYGLERGAYNLGLAVTNKL